MDGMKLDVVDGEHQGLILPAWRLVFSMTPERIILPKNGSGQKSERRNEEDRRRGLTLDPYLQCS